MDSAGERRLVPARSGGVAGLVGESGSGKTMLAMALMGCCRREREWPGLPF